MSQAGDVADGVKAAVTAVLGNGWTVKVRRQPTREDGDPDQLAVVAVGSDKSEILDCDTRRTSYPVAVVLSVKGENRSGLPAVLEAVRDAVQQKLISLVGMGEYVAGLDDLTPGGQSPYPRAASAKNVDALAIQVTYMVREAKS